MLKHLGNDIVDIFQTKRDSNWQRKGFLEKIFSPSEQELITDASDPFLTVWRLWSMKESAYKLYLQQGATRFFNPLKVNCEIFSAEDGKATIADCHMATKTEITHSYIYSTAFEKPSQLPHSCIFALPADSATHQQLFSYQQLFNFIEVASGIDQGQLRIKKTKEGVPELFYKDHKIAVSFSLTHHGKYGAFAVGNLPILLAKCIT